MYQILEHPDITSALRTGYPSRVEDEECESELWGDAWEDGAYEERMERGLFEE